MTLKLPPYRIHLPIVRTPAPVGPAQRDNPCALSAFELDLLDLIRTAPEQERSEMICDIRLCNGAFQRVADCFNHNSLSHVPGIYCFGPNAMARYFRYALPDWYGHGAGANMIESIASDQIEPQGVLDAWHRSPAHARHMYGQDFYRDQTRVGIAHLRMDNYADVDAVAVFWSAPPEEGE